MKLQNMKELRDCFFGLFRFRGFSLGFMARLTDMINGDEYDLALRGQKTASSHFRLSRRLVVVSSSRRGLVADGTRSE